MEDSEIARERQLIRHDFCFIKIIKIVFKHKTKRRLGSMSDDVTWEK
jgi:hypothetical protein